MRRNCFLDVQFKARLLPCSAAIRLAKRFDLFRPAARFAELGIVHPETGQYNSYGVYLLTEHPFDALHKYIPSDAEVCPPSRRVAASTPANILGIGLAVRIFS
jgi:hypothetical protein